MSNKIFL